MQIEVTSKDLAVTPSIYKRIQNQLHKLSKFHIPVMTPHVIIRKEKNHYLIETSLSVPNETLFAHSEHENIFSAINGMRQKLERQINRYLEKPLSQRAVAQYKRSMNTCDTSQTEDNFLSYKDPLLS